MALFKKRRKLKTAKKLGKKFNVPLKIAILPWLAVPVLAKIAFAEPKLVVSNPLTKTVAARKIDAIKERRIKFKETKSTKKPVKKPLKFVLSAGTVDAVLKKAGSPAAGSGRHFIQHARKYNINPAFGLAVFRMESGYGKYGLAAKTKAIGNIRWTKNCGFENYKGFRKYPSWAAGIKDFFRLIASKTYIAGGRKTVKKIVEKYAPSAENQTQLYIDNVRKWMQEFKAIENKAMGNNSMENREMKTKAMENNPKRK